MTNISEIFTTVRINYVMSLWVSYSAILFVIKYVQPSAVSLGYQNRAGSPFKSYPITTVSLQLDQLTKPHVTYHYM